MVQVITYLGNTLEDRILKKGKKMKKCDVSDDGDVDKGRILKEGRKSVRNSDHFG